MGPRMTVAVSAGGGILFLLGIILGHAWTHGVHLSPALVPSMTAATPAPTAMSESDHWTFSNPRFRIVRFREDELLDTLLLAETYRIARIRLQAEAIEPSQFYNDLFSASSTDGFAVVDYHENGTTRHEVILGRSSTDDQGHVRWWTFPSVQYELDWAHRPQPPQLTYQARTLQFTFVDIEDRPILTRFTSEDLLPFQAHRTMSLEYATHITYYERRYGIQEVSEEHLRERFAQAKRILADVHHEAIAAVPDATLIHRPVDLRWVPTDYGFAANVVYGTDQARTIVNINAESLMTYSDMHLRQTFGHEMGHVVRDQLSSRIISNDTGEDPGQMAAEAFALKLMGREKYERVQLFAMGKPQQEVNALIARLEAINAQLPDS